MLVRSVQSIKAYYSQDLILQLQIGCLQASFQAQEEEKSQKILRETISILRNILKKPTIEVMDILIRIFDSPKLSAKLLSPELFKMLVASLKSSTRNDSLCMKIFIVLCNDAALLALQVPPEEDQLFGGNDPLFHVVLLSRPFFSVFQFPRPLFPSGRRVQNARSSAGMDQSAKSEKRRSL